MAKKIETQLGIHFFKRLKLLRQIVASVGQWVVTEEINGYAIWDLSIGFNIKRMYPFGATTKDSAFESAKLHIKDANNTP